MSTQYFSAKVGGLRGPGLTEEQQDSVDQAVADAGDAKSEASAVGGRLEPFELSIKFDPALGFSITDDQGRAALVIDLLNRLVVAGGATITTDMLGGVSATDRDGQAAYAWDGISRLLTVAGTVRSSRRLRTHIPAQIDFHPVYGQSWPTGFENIAELLPQRYNSLMFVGGVRTQSLISSDPDNPARYASLVPLRERQDLGTPKYPVYLPNGIGQSMCTALTDYVWDLLAAENNVGPENVDFAMVSSAPGDGNMNIDQLSKGAGSDGFNTYNRLIAQAQAVAVRAAEMGKTATFSAFTYIQGVGEADWAAKAAQLRADIEADTASAFPLRSDPLQMIIWQRYPEPINGLSPAYCYEQFVQLAKDDPDIHCIGPSYQIEHVPYDGVDPDAHFTAGGTNVLAAMAALVRKRVIHDQLPWEPLDIVSFQRDGLNLIARLNNVYPLTFEVDESVMTPVSNFGFRRLSQTGVVRNITGVELFGTNDIVFRSDTNWLATDRLEAAGIGASGATDGSASGPHDGNRCQLRDTQGDWIARFDPGFRDLPLHNWIVALDKTIG
ncbi:hypothetical protein [Sphingobium sp. DC-2]|uniref:hypothetical protein n=1 Tax=Sphingobium sp. DC-2 TaxID=1303256 RepID=UPI0004C3202F|nr:hypothetical protein [Sphingobium sp. DC-2]